jgi:hypothetical protein
MFLLLISCTIDNIDTAVELPCYTQKPSLMIGTGEQVFEEFNSDDEVVMVHGPQGGWHMLGSIRVMNTAPVVEIDFTITDVESGVEVSNNHYRVGLLLEDDCSGYYPGMYGYLNVQELAGDDGGTPPQLLGNHKVRMYMQTNDCTVSQNEQGICIREERWAEDSFDVHAAIDPVDIPTNQ